VSTSVAPRSDRRHRRVLDLYLRGCRRRFSPRLYRFDPIPGCTKRARGPPQAIVRGVDKLPTELWSSSISIGMEVIDMKRSIVCIGVLCAAAVSSVASGADTSARARFERSPRAGLERVDFPRMQLHNPVDKVLELYEAMATPESVRVYATLERSMRQDLWTVHLERAMVELSNPSPHQRAVILQAIAFVVSDAFHLSRTDPEWESRVAEPVQAIARQAQELFGSRLAGAILANLGPEPDFTRPDGSFVPACMRVREPLLKHSHVQCGCATSPNFCGFWTGGDQWCTATSCAPTIDGCGWFGQSSCDGECLP
jgi:hypothetical protein